MNAPLCVDVPDLYAGIAFYTQGLRPQVGQRLANERAELLGPSGPVDLLANRASTAAQSETHAVRRDYSRLWTLLNLDFVVGEVNVVAQKLVGLGATLGRPINERR